ncbi:MAG: hypothetical protein DDT32_00653 [Syntrophomonadaceae bacterium]|nr:hypothetical protein [Bacillota bacterium]MBT9146906.1 hypothetical protein [Bacillota bacterium]
MDRGIIKRLIAGRDFGFRKTESPTKSYVSHQRKEVLCPKN